MNTVVVGADLVTEEGTGVDGFCEDLVSGGDGALDTYAAGKAQVGVLKKAVAIQDAVGKGFFVESRLGRQVLLHAAGGKDFGLFDAIGCMEDHVGLNAAERVDIPAGSFGEEISADLKRRLQKVKTDLVEGFHHQIIKLPYCCSGRMGR